MVLDMVISFILHQQTRATPRLIAYSEDNPAVKSDTDGMMVMRQCIFSKSVISLFLV